MKSGRERLRDWLGRSKVNQREAAELLGFTEVFLSQILNGVRRPGLENAVRIEDVTGIAAESWLLTDISDSREPVAHGTSKRPQTKR